MEALEWNYSEKNHRDKAESGIVPRGMELRKLLF